MRVAHLHAGYLHLHLATLNERAPQFRIFNCRCSPHPDDSREVGHRACEADCPVILMRSPGTKLPSMRAPGPVILLDTLAQLTHSWDRGRPARPPAGGRKWTSRRRPAGVQAGGPPAIPGGHSLRMNCKDESRDSDRSPSATHARLFPARQRSRPRRLPGLVWDITEVWTADRDFSRFSVLVTRSPLQNRRSCRESAVSLRCRTARYCAGSSSDPRRRARIR